MKQRERGGDNILLVKNTNESSVKNHFNTEKLNKCFNAASEYGDNDDDGDVSVLIYKYAHSHIDCDDASNTGQNDCRWNFRTVHVGETDQNSVLEH